MSAVWRSTCPSLSRFSHRPHFSLDANQWIQRLAGASHIFATEFVEQLVVERRVGGFFVRVRLGIRSRLIEIVEQRTFETLEELVVERLIAFGGFRFLLGLRRGVAGK